MVDLELDKSIKRCNETGKAGRVGLEDRQGVNEGFDGGQIAGAGLAADAIATGCGGVDDKMGQVVQERVGAIQAFRLAPGSIENNQMFRVISSRQRLDRLSAVVGIQQAGFRRQLNINPKLPMPFGNDHRRLLQSKPGNPRCTDRVHSFAVMLQDDDTSPVLDYGNLIADTNRLGAKTPVTEFAGDKILGNRKRLALQVIVR